MPKGAVSWRRPSTRPGVLRMVSWKSFLKAASTVSRWNASLCSLSLSISLSLSLSVRAFHSCLPSSANLDPEYALQNGSPHHPDRELIKTFVPALRSRKYGSTALVTLMAPKTLVSNCATNCSSLPPRQNSSAKHIPLGKG